MKRLVALGLLLLLVLLAACSGPAAEEAAQVGGNPVITVYRAPT